MLNRADRSMVPIVGTLMIAASIAVAAQSTTRPSFDPSRLAGIDAVVNEAIAAHQLPGAVVVVGRGAAIALRKAYGRRAIEPAAEPMTLDTIFDLASLTKV